MTAHTYGFLMDASRCIDCRACLIACSAENNVPMTHTRIWIKDTGIVGDYPDLEHHTIPYHCMHCVDPSCVSACTVGALQQNEDGIVTYDNDRCIGCRYCMYACPFEVPHFEWDQRLALITKCDMCVARLEEGQKEPACAATCPTSAIRFGTREDMLKEAHQRIENEPTRYVDHIFGEHENGGTSTFYISSVPFERLGFPAVQTSESPAEFNRLATEIGTPAIASTVAVGMTGIYLMLNHKEHTEGGDHSERLNEPETPEHEGKEKK